MLRGRGSGLTASLCHVLVFAGNAFVLAGVAGLAFVLLGWMQAEPFADGLSSGVRVIGSVAIGGCLLSAIGYECLDYLEK